MANFLTNLKLTLGKGLLKTVSGTLGLLLQPGGKRRIFAWGLVFRSSGLPYLDT